LAGRRTLGISSRMRVGHWSCITFLNSECVRLATEGTVMGRLLATLRLEGKSAGFRCEGDAFVERHFSLRFEGILLQEQTDATDGTESFPTWSS
jgi:hypothetical protein